MLALQGCPTHVLDQCAKFKHFDACTLFKNNEVLL